MFPNRTNQNRIIYGEFYEIYLYYQELIHGEWTTIDIFPEKEQVHHEETEDDKICFRFNADIDRIGRYELTHVYRIQREGVILASFTVVLPEIPKSFIR